MTDKLIKNLTDSNQAAYTVMKELAEINASVAERLMSQQRAAIGAYFDATSEQMELVTGAKDYKALMSNQTKCAKDQSTKVMAYAQETVEILDEARERLVSWSEAAIENANTSATSIGEALKGKAA